MRRALEACSMADHVTIEASITVALMQVGHPGLCGVWCRAWVRHAGGPPRVVWCVV